MSSITSKAFLAALAGAATVVAHGHVNDIIVNGVQWPGYDPTVFPYMSNPPTVAGWTTSQTDNGFVAPSAFTSGDIICHRNASNAGGHAVVAAGDKVFIQWNTWPESHKGPVIDYLANCGSTGCESVDKTALKFFKIDEVGLVDGSSAPGTWGSDQLIANNNSWLVEIPPTIEPGFYVLRHEIIALHSAGSSDGAQAYPQCFNLQVTGGGSDSPAGTLGESLYGASDPGILVNIYQTLSTYTIPGPALYTGAVSIAQGSSVATVTSTAVTGTATGNAGSATTTADAQPTSSIAAAASTSTAVAATSTAVAATSAAAVATSAADAAVTESTAVASTTPAAVDPTTLATTTAAAEVTSSTVKATAVPVQTGGGCGSRPPQRAQNGRTHARDVRLN
jgi:cellulase